MNISLNKIKSYGFDVDSEKLDNYLTQLGHEVESIDNLNIDNLVIGQVISKVKHPDADKLNVVKVNVGNDELQIVCGAPNVDVSQKVIVALNGAVMQSIGLTIKPIKLKGIESNGMICSLAELNLSKSVLNSKDIDGICVLNDDAPIGENALEYLGLNDEILDVSLTADRGDCQSYLGIKKDLVAFYKSNELRVNEVVEKSPENKVEIKNNFGIENNVQETKYFSHTLLKDITITDSSIHVQIELMKNGIKPQNNVVDIVNLAMLEYGLPMHVYDADKIKGKLNVTLTDKEEVFIALDKVEYKLAKKTLVIKDEEKIVAIAGVIGSEETKVTNETKNVLLENAIFDPYLVRVAAKNIFKKTDASIRFEKGVASDRIEISRNYVISRLECSTSNTHEIDNRTNLKKQITIDFESIKKTLGLEISNEKINEILTNLEFNKLDENTFEIPFARHDINYENDIAEEIIRVFGLDNLETSETLLTINKLTKINEVNPLIMRKVEDSFMALGLNQVITYSLIGDNQVSRFTKNKKEAVSLIHPMSEERKTYRKSIVNSLLQVALYNFKRQASVVNIFEQGNIYYKENNEIIEETKISGLLAGEKENYYLGSKSVYDFYDLKGILEGFFTSLNINVSYQIPKEEELIDELNPYAQATISNENGKVIGFIGEVHLDLIGKNKYPIYVFEINYDMIKDQINKMVTYTKVNELPSIFRDLTLVANKEVETKVFFESFENVEYLKDVILVDYFDDKVKMGDKKALTFKLEFENSDKTLTSEEVDDKVKQIIEKANNNNITL